MRGTVLSFPDVRAVPHEFAVLEMARPGAASVAIGIFLLRNGELDFRLRTDWEEFDLPDDDLDYCSLLEEDFSMRIQEMGGTEFLASLEDSLSNYLRVSAREAAGAYSVDELFSLHVDQRVREYETHLPVYSLRAAATRFGEDTEVEIASWRRADGMRLAPGMFVAQVVGRSMEPLIPDGSFCVFRSPVVGSRQGKRLLIEMTGASGTSGRYTVKRYTSVKRRSGEEWEHASIRLEPLNPEFDAFELGEEDFRVLGEFLGVLPAH